MKIQIRKTDGYGNKRPYPACDKAKLFALIAGTITLTPYTMSLIEQLGYEIEEVH
jgi:hypothetical protein